MRFLVDARFTPGSDPEPRMEDERTRVRELREEGLIEQLFRRIDGTGAYLVVGEESEDAARLRLETLPFVEDGTMSLTIEEIETL